MFRRAKQRYDSQTTEPQIALLRKMYLDRLVKYRLVMVHPTNYGKQYSLNPKTLDKIINIIE